MANKYPMVIKSFQFKLNDMFYLNIPIYINCVRYIDIQVTKWITEDKLYTNYVISLPKFEMMKIKAI